MEWIDSLEIRRKESGVTSSVYDAAWNYINKSRNILGSVMSWKSGRINWNTCDESGEAGSVMEAKKAVEDSLK